MKFNFEELKIPKDCELVSQEQDKSIVVKKGNYLLDIKLINEAGYRWRKSGWRLRYNISKQGDHIDNGGTAFWRDDIEIKNINKAIEILKMYPTIEQENSAFLSPSKIVGENLGFGKYSTGVTGTIRKYFQLPCVVSYALSKHHCYMVIKMQKSGYKGLLWIGGQHIYGYFSRVQELDLKNALEGISRTINQKPMSQELSEKDLSEIMAKLV